MTVTTISLDSDREPEVRRMRSGVGLPRVSQTTTGSRAPARGANGPRIDGSRPSKGEGVCGNSPPEACVPTPACRSIAGDSGRWATTQVAGVRGISSSVDIVKGNV